MSIHLGECQIVKSPEFIPGAFFHEKSHKIHLIDVIFSMDDGLAYFLCFLPGYLWLDFQTAS